MAHPQLSPRLHSLPDNVLSPLGLLAEASLQNTPGKSQGRYGRPSTLNLDRPMGRNGSSGLREESMNRVMMSDVRGGEVKVEESSNQGDDDAQGSQRRGSSNKDGKSGAAVAESGLAGQNYFKPIGVGVHVGPPGNRVSWPMRILWYPTES